MKKNALISSILTIALCVSLIAGSTFALFTSEDSINVAVTAAKVKVSATVDNLQTYSMDALQSAGSFENGGTAAYDEATGKLTLTNVAPGDRVEFPINITNDSNINIQYRVKWTVEGDLVDALVATVDGVALTSSTSDWTLWKTDDTKTKTLNVAVELPVDAGDEYQEKTAEVAFVVEAVQGNAIVDKVTTADQLAATLMMGRTATLGDDVELDAASAISIPAGSVATIDLSGYTLTGNNAANEGAVIVNNGILNIVGTTGTLTNSVVNGAAVVENNGTMTISSANIIGAPIGESGYPAYAVTTSGDLTIEAGTTITSDRGVISMSNGANVTINGGNFTVSGAANGRTNTFHTVYAYGYSSTLTINDGYFEQAFDSAAGSSVICPAGATIEINGGDFRYTGVAGSQSGVFQLYFGYGAPIRVNGGTFNDTTVTNRQITIGEYYETVLDAATGIYTVQPKANVAFVQDSTDFTAAFADTSKETVVLSANIEGVDANTAITVAAGRDVTLDLNGHKISSTANKTGNQELFLVKGNMKVKNGSLELVAKNNQGWNAMATLFDVTAGGALDMNGVTANVSGTDMNFVVHLNNWGSATLNVNECDFATTYVAVRAFNSGYDMNTVTIKNTDFHGGRMFWVHNYTSEGKDDSTLTLDIYGNNNTSDNAKPVRFGFSNSSYFNLDGAKIVEASASTQTNFADAVASGDIVTVTLEQGTYEMPTTSGKTVTIAGTKDTVIDLSNYAGVNQSGSDATLVFDGVTVKCNTVNYYGLAHTKKVVYKNCDITGLQFLYADEVEFINCKFDSNGAEHSVWTYGAEKVSFTDCKFTYADRCINAYGDTACTETVVNFTNCEFTSTNPNSKGAVEINSMYFTTGITVNMEGCTAPAYGEMAYVSPWDSTNGAKTTINIK